jgi:diguanylate cyclase (GGDEF)-like protein
VVEDSLPQAFLLKKLLVEHRFRVRLATNGRQALEELESRPAAMVLSDVDMPEMNGYAMCEAIKAHPRLAHIPVILLTTLCDVESIILGLRARADYYLTKPYTPRYLLERVGVLLNQAAALETEDAAEPIELNLAGHTHRITAGRRQMLRLLLSTYENAIEQNRELIRTQHELHQRNQQLKDANRQLESLATTDGLTGLKNRRAFQERLDEEFQRAARYQTPLSVVLLDVDHFKSYNDTYGHPAGDEVLRTLARLLQSACRETDIVARYGGEEFVALLPLTPAAQAMELAERMRSTLEQAAWPSRLITASLGVADNTRADNSAALVAQADAALYASKQAGRNRVTAAGRV